MYQAIESSSPACATNALLQFSGYDTAFNFMLANNSNVGQSTVFETNYLDFSCYVYKYTMVNRQAPTDTELTTNYFTTDSDGNQSFYSTDAYTNNSYSCCSLTVRMTNMTDEVSHTCNLTATTTLDDLQQLVFIKEKVKQQGTYQQYVGVANGATILADDYFYSILPGMLTLFQMLIGACTAALRCCRALPYAAACLCLALIVCRTLRYWCASLFGLLCFLMLLDMYGSGDSAISNVVRQLLSQSEVFSDWWWLTYIVLTLYMFIAALVIVNFFTGIVVEAVMEKKHKTKQKSDEYHALYGGDGEGHTDVETDMQRELQQLRKQLADGLPKALDCTLDCKTEDSVTRL